MKTSGVLNVLLVGCGRIVSKHIAAIQSCGVGNIQIVGVVDIDLAKAKRYADLLSVPYYRAVADLNDSLNIDLAVVMTDSGAHFSVTCELLSKGFDVLVEKPMALTLEHASEMVDLAKKLSRNLFVVKQNRFNDAVQKVRSLVLEKKLGQLNSAAVCVRWCRDQKYYDQAPWRGTWLDDGGVIANQAIHHIDLLVWLMGDVECVSAFDANLMSEFEAEDTICAIIKFKSGAVGVIEATTAARPNNIEGSLSLLGSAGYAKIGGHAVNELTSLITNEASPELALRENNGIQDTTDVYGDGHQAIYREIIKFLRGSKNSAVLGDDGIESLRLIHMIYRSVECDKTIYNTGVDSEISSMRLGRNIGLST